MKLLFKTFSFILLSQYILFATTYQCVLDLNNVTKSRSLEDRDYVKSLGENIESLDIKFYKDSKLYRCDITKDLREILACQIWYHKNKVPNLSQWHDGILHKSFNFIMICETPIFLN